MPQNCHSFSRDQDASGEPGAGADLWDVSEADPMDMGDDLMSAVDRVLEPLGEASDPVPVGPEPPAQPTQCAEVAAWLLVHPGRRVVDLQTHVGVASDNSWPKVRWDIQFPETNPKQTSGKKVRQDVSVAAEPWFLTSSS